MHAKNLIYYMSVVSCWTEHPPNNWRGNVQFYAFKITVYVPSLSVGENNHYSKTDSQWHCYKKNSFQVLSHSNILWSGWPGSRVQQGFLMIKDPKHPLTLGLSLKMCPSCNTRRLNNLNHKDFIIMVISFLVYIWEFSSLLMSVPLSIVAD